MLIVRQVVGAAVVPDLLFGDQMVFLITLALKGRAVALCARVVVTHAHRIVPRVKSTVRFVSVRRRVLVIHQCVHFSLTVGPHLSNPRPLVVSQINARNDTSSTPIFWDWIFSLLRCELDGVTWCRGFVVASQ